MKRKTALAAAGVLVVSCALSAPTAAVGGRGRGGGGGARVSPGARGGGGVGRAPVRPGQRPGGDVRIGRPRDGGGRRHGPRYWHPGFFYGGWGGFGSPFYHSPFYDPFYHGYAHGYAGGEPGERDGKKGNVELKVSPKDAVVSVNGVEYGKAGGARLNLPAGQWRIEIRAPGHVPQVIDLNVEQGIRYTIERKLKKDQSLDRDGKPLKVEELPERG